MAKSVDTGRSRPISFSVSELTGALGDSVTVIPLVVAIAALTPLSLPRLLLGFALFQAVWGLYYRLPLSVEPMKALAALVVAGALSADELAAAGLLAGVALLAVGRLGWLTAVQRVVSRPVVRGVQLAVALVLLRTAVDLSLGAPTLAMLGVGVALVVAVLASANLSILAVLGVGVALVLTQAPAARPVLSLTVPTLPLLTVPSPALSAATVDGLVGQLAMTVGNAAVATSLLLSEYFDAEVSPDDLATSMGVMNLVAVPLGALPMCHGSGGVAGKYAFGARTAGSNLILAAGYGFVAVFAVGVFTAFPVSILGVLLALVAVELGRSAFRTDHLPLTLGVGLCGLLTNVGVAFVAGVALCVLLRRADRSRHALVNS